MRWRRAALFAAIVVAHVLAVLFFPAGSVTHDLPEQEISFATLMLPESMEERSSPAIQHRSADAITARRPAGRVRPARRAQTSHMHLDAGRAHDVQPDAVANPARSIDWAREAQIAVDDRVRQDAETAYLAAALSRWHTHVMPAPRAPKESQFRWDYARTHRLESSALGLKVNLNDRCSLLISLYMMAIMGGCKIGELPVHGDLFMHMRGDTESDASVTSTAP
jgi:hypothetical protein